MGRTGACQILGREQLLFWPKMIQSRYHTWTKIRSKTPTIVCMRSDLGCETFPGELRHLRLAPTVRARYRADLRREKWYRSGRQTSGITGCYNSSRCLSKLWVNNSRSTDTIGNGHQTQTNIRRNPDGCVYKYRRVV